MAPVVAATVAPAAIDFAKKNPIISLLGLCFPILMPCCCVSSFIAFIAFICHKIGEKFGDDDKSS